MSDWDVIYEIRRMVKGASFRYTIDDICVSATLTNANNPFFGCIRHHSPSDKRRIITLINKLEGLRNLDLRKNRMGKIDLSGLQNLEHLDLSSNYMGEVPKWVRGNPLKSLSLGVNELETIPEWMGEFENIETLKLHKNQLRDVACISSYKKMKFLNLYLNRIKQLPDFLWELPDIEFFSWGVSAIKEIPEDIGKWRNLRWLSLVANKLERLPDNICDLTQLKGIRAHKNRLVELPERIGNLHQLRQLTLYKNNLKRLPDSFQQLKLNKLNLAHNPLDKRGLQAKWLCLEPMDCQWQGDGNERLPSRERF